MMIGAHVSGVAKEDLGLFSLRQGFDLRVVLLEPLLDHSLVALLRTMQGFWQVMPSCASSRPTELALNATPNLSLINFATMARVHSAKANFSCNGFFCVMVL